MYVHGSPQPLLLSDVLCGDVSHSAECFYYGLPPLLTSVGNKILVPGVVERLLWIWRPLLQRANYSFPILLLVVPRGLCSSTCVKGSWFWNKYYIPRRQAVVFRPCLSNHKVRPRPSQKKGQRQDWGGAAEVCYSIQLPNPILVVGCKRSDFWRNTTLCSDLEQRQRGASLILSAATVSFSSDSPWCDSRQASALLRHSPWPTRSRSIPPTSTGIIRPILVSEIHSPNSPYIFASKEWQWLHSRFVNLLSNLSGVLLKTGISM